MTTRYELHNIIIIMIIGVAIGGARGAKASPLCNEVINRGVGIRGHRGQGPLVFRRKLASYIVRYKSQDHSKRSSIKLLKIFGLFRLVILQYSR